ncbi:MAG: Na/Pi cotransporter family protein [Candidatus Omnitrophica bacterium]|nr:Na/Pi cotransporter family protein [Candidatus Omnitrophota bacterium]
MDTNLIFMLIGGLGLFFFGMQIMSEGLKNIAGDRLKAILHMVTKLPIIGILVGFTITALIQSSSATTVMVVGFVNAGLIVLKQAISVIIGANIGTTVTAWLVSSMSVLKVTHYALPAVGIGFALTTFGRTKNAKFWGQVLMGFGLLFMGLGFMKDAFMPLRESQHVIEMFAKFGDNPMLGILVGILVTMLIQSSSATIAIVQVMAFNGIISFPAAITLMLGGDIGTTITAQLAAIGTNLEARRAAMAHTLFNFIGVGYMIIFIYNGWFVSFVDFLIPGEITIKNIMFYIAVANTIFKLTNACIFLPFIGLLEKACIFLVPKRKGMIEMGPQYLEKHLLVTPPIAMEQARKETVRMLSLSCRSVSSAMKSFFEDDLSEAKPVERLEQAVDNLQSAITQYLVELSQEDLSREVSEELPVLIHSVNDIERIGDHAENIVELTERKIEKKLPFSEEATSELTLMWNELSSMMIEAQEALRGNDTETAENVLRREEQINKFQIDLKKAHVSRLNQSSCDMRSGVVFMDLVDNMEKIGDHLSNIAQGVVSGMRWMGEREGESLPAEETV